MYLNSGDAACSASTLKHEIIAGGKGWSAIERYEALAFDS